MPRWRERSIGHGASRSWRARDPRSGLLAADPRNHRRQPGLGGRDLLHVPRPRHPAPRSVRSPEGRSGRQPCGPVEGPDAPRRAARCDRRSHQGDAAVDEPFGDAVGAGVPGDVTRPRCDLLRMCHDDGCHGGGQGRSHRWSSDRRCGCLPRLRRHRRRAVVHLSPEPPTNGEGESARRSHPPTGL